jgi:hypothetical protein
MLKRRREPTMARSRPGAPEKAQRLIDAAASRVARHDVEGWYGELERVYRSSVEHNLGLHKEDPRIKIINNAGPVTLVHIAGPFASFTVNVNMPDAILHAEFDRWLTQVRNQLPSPIKMRGTPSSNAKFNETKFEVWRETKIIEFADLLAWRATLDESERKKYRKSTLGRWIERYNSKDVNTTERLLRSALASLSALLAQVEHEHINRQPDSDALISGRIKRDIARPFPRIRRVTRKDA